MMKLSIPLHYKQLLCIAIPIIIGQVGAIVLGLADTLMIGQHSTLELAAAGLVNNIFNLVLVPYQGFSYGLTPSWADSRVWNTTRKLGKRCAMHCSPTF